MARPSPRMRASVTCGWNARSSVCPQACIRAARKAVISVNSRSPERRRRFSLAHELGHWHHHCGRVLFCGKDDIGNFANDALNPERHADTFASDLILPDYLFIPRIQTLN